VPRARHRNKKREKRLLFALRSGRNGRKSPEQPKKRKKKRVRHSFPEEALKKKGITEVRKREKSSPSSKSSMSHGFWEKPGSRPEGGEKKEGRIRLYFCQGEEKNGGNPGPSGLVRREGKASFLPYSFVRGWKEGSEVMDRYKRGEESLG